MTDAEETRGVSDEDLVKLPDQNLIFLALALILEAELIDDEALSAELYRRGREA